MPLSCIDKITLLEKGVRIRAEKTVRPEEEHFRDHFSGFAVLPGVLMLEGLAESAAALVRATDDFARTQVYLVSCSQVKFSKLVRPLTRVVFEAEIVSNDGAEFEFKGKVLENDRAVAVARFRMRAESVGETFPLYAHLEAPLAGKQRRLLDSLYTV